MIQKQMSELKTSPRSVYKYHDLVTQVKCELRRTKTTLYTASNSLVLDLFVSIITEYLVVGCLVNLLISCTLTGMKAMC